MAMLVKVHRREGRTLVAVCDERLIGQRLEDGDRQIDLTGEFFKGDLLTPGEAGDLIRNADMVNLVGHEAVELGINEGVVEKESVVTIAGVPVAQAVLLQEA
jgi:hypothetical protein